MKLPALPVTQPATPLETSAPLQTRPALPGKETLAKPEAATTTNLALEAALEKIRQSVGNTGQQVSFSVDDSSGKTVLRVIDAQTNAILRQIPGDEALALARTLDRMQGMLIRQKA